LRKIVFDLFKSITNEEDWVKNSLWPPFNYLFLFSSRCYKMTLNIYWVMRKSSWVVLKPFAGKRETPSLGEIKDE
jgi:hypothetical protein